MPGRRAVAPGVERPFDPDELPIEALRTDEEREFTATLPARAYAPGGVDARPADAGNHDGRGRPARDRGRFGLEVHHRADPRRELTPGAPVDGV